MISIYFAGIDPAKGMIPLAHACGVAPPGEGEDQSVNVNRYDRLNQQASLNWRVSSLQEADVIVYPHAYWGEPAALEAAECARDANLPCLFFRTNDDATPADPPWGIVYRDSIFESQRTAAERGLPAFTNDLLRNDNGELTPRQKQQQPLVGFCGYTGSALRRAIFRLTGRRAKVDGLSLRNKTLTILQRNNRVQTQFIRRRSFWGGAISRFRRDYTLQQQVRDEFLNNLFNTDYNVCLRGKGNFSYRFYEVLCAGRIPLFINTGCVLPFEETINWRDHCVWVEHNQIESAGEILADFHASIAEDEFQQMQIENRRLWVEYLSPFGFYHHALREAVESSEVQASTQAELGH